MYCKINFIISLSYHLLPYEICKFYKVDQYQCSVTSLIQCHIHLYRSIRYFVISMRSMYSSVYRMINRVGNPFVLWQIGCGPFHTRLPLVINGTVCSRDNYNNVFQNWTRSSQESLRVAPSTRSSDQLSALPVSIYIYICTVHTIYHLSQSIISLLCPMVLTLQETDSL